MAVVALSNIEKTFGKRVLFDHLELTVYEGERIGLIGDNGSGKTTLLKVITGEVVADVGTLAIAKSTKVGYLTQDPVFSGGNTVMDEAELAFARLHELSHRLRDIEHEMEHLRDEELEKLLRVYQNVQHEFELAGGYAWRHRVEGMLDGVGLERATWEQEVQTLSGGQQSRLALAKLLIAEPELLLLDEPTNHLDLSAIEWLENYLLEFRGAVLLISHDRFLLDRLATRVVWLNQCRLTSYKGNYSAFVQQKQLQELTQQRAYEEQQEDIEKQKEFIRRFGAGQRSKEAKGREKRLNRLLKSDAVIQAVEGRKQIHLSLNTNQRAGDQVLRVRELSKAYDGKVLWKDVRFDVVRGERVGIIGPNGSGKTTLLEVLLGQRDADGGQIKWGANLNIGYYDQKLDDFDPENTVIEELDEGRGLKEKQLRDVLAMMLFRGEDVHKPVGLLSGGERARLALAGLLADKPNVLVLDEPTNHLDIASCEALETALGDFAGSILCVSHDRYFLDRMIRRLLVLRPPGVVDFEGNYSAWMAKLQAQARKKAQEQAKVKARPRPAGKSLRPTSGQTNSYQRPFGRLETKELEVEIQQTEARLAQCQNLFAQTQSFRDPQRGRELHAEYESLRERLRQLEAEYFAR